MSLEEISSSRPDLNDWISLSMTWFIYFYFLILFTYNIFFLYIFSSNDEKLYLELFVNVDAGDIIANYTQVDTGREMNKVATLFRRYLAKGKIKLVIYIYISSKFMQ